MIANLFENAIQAISRFEACKERVIHLTCVQKGRLLLQITNPCAEDTELDSDGLPASKEQGHGIGTKSIVAFASKYDAELLYHIKDGLFCAQLLI